ncbi:hypothetical protein D9M71_151290 [compost metagenome]
MAVVLVGGDGVQTEARVGGRIDRQGVVVTHDDRLAVANHQQFRREGAVEGPDGLVRLDRHVRVEAHVDALGRALDLVGRNLGAALEVVGLVVETGGAELALAIAVPLIAVTHAAVDPRAGLHGLERALRIELVVALVRPALSRRTAFRGRLHHALEEAADLRRPRVAVAIVGEFAGQRIQPGEFQECVQLGAYRRTAHDDRVALRGRARLRRREAAGRWRGIGVERHRAEFLEQQQRLGERLGAEQRARPAVGGDVERGLLGGRQDVVREDCLAIARYAAGLFERTFVRRRHAVQLIGPGIARRVVIGRGIVGGRLAEIVEGHGGCRGDATAQQEEGAEGDTCLSEA